MVSKKLRKRGKEDLRELILDETVEERYERLKVGERTGMALSTYKKLDDVFKDIEKGDYGRHWRKFRVDIMKAFFGE